MLRIRFSGALARLVGCAEITVEPPQSHRLDELLAVLENKYPGLLGTSADYQWRHGSTHVMIAVNGKIIEGASEDIRLSDDDEVSLVPPLGGGSQ